MTGYNNAFDDLTAAVIHKLKAGKAYDSIDRLNGLIDSLKQVQRMLDVF